MKETTPVTRRGGRKSVSVCFATVNTHLASGPLLLARWPRIFSTTVTLPLLAASSSSWSLPMVHLHRERTAMYARTLVNLCFHYDYSRFIDPAWPSWADWRAATRLPRELPAGCDPRRASRTLRGPCSTWARARRRCGNAARRMNGRERDGASRAANRERERQCRQSVK